METFSEGNPSHDRNESTIRTHLLSAKIADLRLVEVTRGRIEALLDEKQRKEGLSAQTVNHIRAFLSRACSAAIAHERWSGKNPAAETKKRHGPKRAPDFLRFEEVGPVMAQVPPQHFHRFVTTLYTDLRKGELRALRKTDIDWSLNAIWVRRSGIRDTTKGGHEKPIPIHPDLGPILREAMAASPSELVFPAPGGGMVRDDVKFALVLRRAMARAGIVEGYRHVCRQQGCRYEERASDLEERTCPEHGMRLWPKALVRKITFHNLPHELESVPHVWGPAGDRAEDAAPHRPQDHIGRLRPPAHELPARGHLAGAAPLPRDPLRGGHRTAANRTWRSESHPGC
ncbi:MAG TPA: hypothetical protein VLV17_09855 [Anaeromyxobacteraceae bacterium]|nr:hypothetical protein [Anaeromyxobacteraceae bacterium]